jgi:apolipoprotein N-acyltransferase
MPPTIKILGYAGLIPFICLPVLSIAIGDKGQMEDALALYAFGIFTFLCGSWWPTADLQVAKFWRIVLSNILFLTAFFIFLLLPNQWLAIAPVLFILIWAIERFSSVIPETSHAYKDMRTVLSVVASLSMIITYVFGAA